MALIRIDDGLLNDSEIKNLERAIGDAAREKKKTGIMNLDRFIKIVKSVCSWFWDKISGFISSIWDGLTSIF